MALIADFSICGGINNVDRNYRLLASARRYEVVEALNVDITNRGSVVKRGGLLPVSSGNYDCLFEFKNKLCYVKDGQLYMDNNQILNVSGNVKYVTDGDTLLLMDNRGVYRIRENGSYSIVEGLSGGGQAIEFVLSSIFVSYNNRVVCTPPMGPDEFWFPSYVTMLKSVPKGLYIGDLNSVYFLSPVSSEALGMREVLNERPFRGSAVKINLSLVNERLSGVGIIFVTKSGLYVGNENGEVFNVKSNYIFTEGRSATVRLDKARGIYQYIYV